MATYLRSGKKQPKKNAIFNLSLEKLEALATNKEQITERLDYLVEIKILQKMSRNGVNSFHIINNEMKVLNRLSYKLSRIHS